jgi:hypothetical protein
MLGSRNNTRQVGVVAAYIAAQSYLYLVTGSTDHAKPSSLSARDWRSGAHTTLVLTLLALSRPAAKAAAASATFSGAPPLVFWNV